MVVFGQKVSKMRIGNGERQYFLMLRFVFSIFLETNSKRFLENQWLEDCNLPAPIPQVSHEKNPGWLGYIGV